MLWAGKHKCVVGKCTAVVSPDRLMCEAHWSLVNPGLQTMYWRMRHGGRPRDGFEDVCKNIVEQVEEFVLYVHKGRYR